MTCRLCGRPGDLPTTHAPGCLVADEWCERVLAAARAAAADRPGRWRPAARSIVVTPDYELVLRGRPTAVALAALMDPAAVIALVEAWRRGASATPGPRTVNAVPQSPPNPDGESPT